MKPTQLYKLGFSNVLFEYGGTMLTMLLQIVTLVFIVRLFTIEEFGVYNILISTLAMASFFFSFGITPIIERFIPEFHQKKNFFMIKRVLLSALGLRLAIGVFIMFALNLFAVPLASFLNAPELAEYLPLFSLVILVYLESELLEVFLKSMLLQKYHVFCRAIFFSVRLVLYYFVLKDGYGLNGVVLALFISYLPFILLMLWKVRSAALKKVDQGKKEYSFMDFARYGLPFHFSVLGDLATGMASSVFFVTFFLGTASAGLFAFAAGIVFTLIGWSPAAALMSVSTSVLIRRYVATGSKKVLEYLYQVYTRIIAFTSFPLLVGLLVLSDKIIIHVFKPEYMETHLVLCLIAVFFLLEPLRLPVTITFQALKRSDIALWGKIAVIYNIAMNIILLPIYGILGAAFAIGSSMWVMRGIEFFMTNRLVRLPVPWEQLARAGLNSLIMGAVVFSVRPFVTDLWTLLAAVALGAVSYVVFSYFNKVFTDEDRKFFEKASNFKIPF